ncbi:hypothetical protein HDE68_000522 [Pedobacter cryoconitis]|uniref:DUF3352 domain-containing protein n=1 Tax=Pedobacter cryoconitis TaxID=188932 RepID=A0A7W8ZIQ1_9SPHI|nr:hypothetical protein [Pedobacter cryoconitis]MBB5634637.1 hypothetical protein [Pedobacter cryoconitis]
MKKIYLTLFTLFAAIVGMAYLYFSKLNQETTYKETSLYAATANSGLIFCMQNDKSIFDILKGQDFFQKLLGQEKFNQLSLLKNKLITNPAVNNLIGNRKVFISFSAGKNKEIDYLISTQLNDELEKPKLYAALKSAGINVNQENGMLHLILNDSASFYLNIEKNLILLSNSAAPVKAAATSVSNEENNQFVTYIKSSNKFSRNSLGNLYIDFNKIPALLKSMLPGNLNGPLSALNHQNSFAVLNYNFSKERVFFNGGTQLNDKKSYLTLFAALAPQKNSIDNLLPENTANFQLYALTSYTAWRKELANWFTLHKEDQKIKNTINSFNKEYHLDAEKIFPVYFQNQLISFQLKSAENMAAINLTNGDKVEQLLLDMSDDYNQDIKRFKKSGLLYCYFGEPFKSFSRPYYTIIDNYMVFSNQPGALQSFLNDYHHNKLLINTPDYINVYSQISKTANITYYVNRKNSENLVRKAIYTPYYNHYIKKQGLEQFTSFVYQLSGDQGAFQTNLLLNTMPAAIPDTLENLTN